MIESYENQDYIKELADEFNVEIESIVADLARDGLELDHDGTLIHIHTPWAVGVLNDED